MAESEEGESRHLRAVSDSDPAPNPGLDHVELQGAPLEEIRFRLQRHRAEDFENLRLHFAFFDPEGRLVQVPVIDFSERGLGIEMPQNVMFRSGELLRDVEIHAGERCAYRGDATVVPQRGRPDRLGIALMGEGLDVERLIEQDKKASKLAELERHLRALRQQIDPNFVPASYRAAVADLQTLLLGLQLQLSNDEFRSDELQGIEDLVVGDFLRITAEMQETVEGQDRVTINAAAAYAKRLLHPLLLMGEIPRRAYEKPLGYAGDYALMDLVYRRTDDGETPFTRIVDRLCCRMRGARAAASRIDMLTDFLEGEIKARAGRRVRIGSMACGPAEEITRLLKRRLPADTPVDIALIDQDRDALSYCSRRMLRLEGEGSLEDIDVGYFHTSVKTIVTNPGAIDALLGRFDVAYTVGLFDYLPDSAARSMIDSLVRFVAPGGVLVVGNFTNHDGQAFMEHVLDWRLLYRKPEALRQLAVKALGDDADAYEIDVASEENDTHLFLILRRR